MSKKTFQVKFSSIELIGKSLEFTQEQVDLTDVNFNFLIDLRFSRERNLALIITDVTLSRFSNKEKLAYFKLLCVFEIPEFDKVLTRINENVFDIPVELEIFLKSTGLSTIRGVIYSELRGTSLHGAVLPFIDISSIVLNNRKELEKSTQHTKTK